MAYTQLLEQDRLDEARVMDARYHTAALVALAFGDPQKIYDERDRWRAGLFAEPSTVPAPMTHEAWLAKVAAIHQKMQRAGLVTSTGAMH